MTGGITTFLLLIKCTYGAKYLYYASRSYRNRLEREIFGRKMTIIKGCLMPNNPETVLRQRIQKTLVKRQRRELNDFFIASTVYYIFMLILCFCILPVAAYLFLYSPSLGKLFADAFFYLILFISMGTGSLWYAVRRINWLLWQKDHELQYRSMKVFRDGCGGEVDIMR